LEGCIPSKHTCYNTINPIHVIIKLNLVYIKSKHKGIKINDRRQIMRYAPNHLSTITFLIRKVNLYKTIYTQKVFYIFL